MKPIINTILTGLFVTALPSPGRAMQSPIRVYQNFVAKKVKPHEAILEAAAQGDISEVRQQLADGVNPNLEARSFQAKEAGFPTGTTTLCYAAEGGHQEIVQLLLKHGANVKSKYTSIFTPLHFAAGSGHTEMVALLLEAGVNPNESHFETGSPLHIAANADTIEVLLQAPNINPNSRTPRAGYTPLHSALAARNWEATKKGLPHFQAIQLQWQRMADMPRAIHLLVKAGVDPDARDTREYLTALHLATLERVSPAHDMNDDDRNSVIHALIEAGADIEACGGDHYAIPNPFGISYDKPQTLVGQRLIPRAKLQTPLQTAAGHDGSRVAMRLLLELGAQLKPNEQDGWQKD